MFVEPLDTWPLSFQIDRSGAFSDSKCISPLSDPAVSSWAIAAVVEYFALRGIEAI